MRSPAGRLNYARPTPRSGALPAPRGPASRRMSCAREVREGEYPRKSWPPGLAHRVGEVARGSAQLSPVNCSLGARPTPRSGPLPVPGGAHWEGAASRRKSCAREVREGESCHHGLRASSFLARWRVYGRPGQGIGSGDDIGEGTTHERRETLPRRSSRQDAKKNRYLYTQ